ncbi:phage holin family protein [Enterococcus olivae]
MDVNQWFQTIKEHNILYVLSVLAIAMVLDFFSGILAAKWMKAVTSKIGINGILRKLASMILLIFFLPVAFLLPAYAGMTMLYVLYLGYLFLEIQSILENYQKMGIDVEPFKRFLIQLKEMYQKKK